ncbi:hypothetical protein [Aneurinibacillus migulanus]|uniref:Uncharacterized protein n=1 Tax=Aneurinibacillus migulanus TaxID=47500 RepID=A0A1G8LWZ2_ANEMI|nr:hypothetical protein [Aneurinibacillus migulanus]MED0893379.1 hypothetical protein [Aneurinibacillus migulanus]MED1615316.1 hypothetical protein [Aneurinibacillus migulanus]MED4727703.1 hypothetical protein [Aneurinibacillus migulanus]SDI60175.1 hypothetical protein SAMN04487909_105252 [Aneurinibacillus migulanus]GED14214.1 hypothetical protein AMI01nite_22050 [Aneurinibacillus migulanus]
MELTKSKRGIKVFATFLVIEGIGVVDPFLPSIVKQKGGINE